MERRVWKILFIGFMIMALVATLPLAGCRKKVPIGDTAGVSTSGGASSSSAATVGGATSSAGAGSSTSYSSGDIKPEPGPAATAPTLPPVNPCSAQNVRAFQAEKIHFAFDRADLSPEAMSILKKKAAFLRQCPTREVLIQGHCDERGTNEYNIALGDRRANSARNFLVDLGINPRRVSTVSYGEEQPMAPGHDEASWAENRRCEFVLE